MDGEKRLLALQDAALAVSSARGERIFAELTRYLATILHCELALMGRIVGDKIRTLGVHGERGYRDNFEYALRLNDRLSYGSLSVRNVCGEPMFVMSRTFPRDHVSAADIRAPGSSAERTSSSKPAMLQLSRADARRIRSTHGSANSASNAPSP